MNDITSIKIDIISSNKIDMIFMANFGNDILSNNKIDYLIMANFLTR